MNIQDTLYKLVLNYYKNSTSRDDAKYDITFREFDNQFSAPLEQWDAYKDELFGFLTYKVAEDLGYSCEALELNLEIIEGATILDQVINTLVYNIQRKTTLGV